MKDIPSFLWETSKIIVLALIIVVPLRLFLFQPFIVRGSSMEPNFHSGDYLIIDEISYRFSETKRGEVVVLKNPKDTSQRFIKRIIGLPGETVQIEGGRVAIIREGKNQVLNESFYLSGVTYTSGNLIVSLGANEYFALGDNRPASFDSRYWGVFPRENIIGKVFVRVLPIQSFIKIEVPIYLPQ